MGRRVVIRSRCSRLQRCAGCPSGAASATTTPPGTDAPIPDTPAPTDALPEAVRRIIDTPFTGDFPEMVKRRAIRVGVTFNRTHYFIDRGQERGLTYEALKAFETELNTDLKSGNLRVHVVIVPMSRDQLHAALASGRIDMVAAMVTVQAGTRGGGCVLRADPHRRERGRRHRARRAAHQRALTISPERRCSSARRASITRRLARLNEDLQEAREAGHRHRRSARRARRRRRAGDGQRRASRRSPSSTTTWRPSGSRYSPISRCATTSRSHGRQAGGCLSQGEPPAARARSTRWVAKAPEGRRLPQRHRAPLPGEHQVREERRGRRRAQEARAA